MLPNAVEPGTRLVDRYLLEEILGEAGGTAYWRAHDELLDRPVGVCLLADEPERAEQILRAARRAAIVNDPRFLRILDASESDGVVYVVNEWVKASSLAELVADGPLPAAEARTLALEIAQALVTAHREGLAHLCLEPQNVLRTSQGQVKISGLAVDAAVRGLEPVDPADAARRDAEGCAAVLYAALTARWPVDTASRLPPAPQENGEICSPRQVRAGIPHDLDEITCRALGAHLRDPAQRVETPEALAILLADSSPAQRARVSERTSDPTEALRLRPAAATGADGPAYAAAYDAQNPRRRGLTTRIAWIGAALALLVGVGLTGYQLATGAFGDPPAGRDNTKSGKPTAEKPLKPLRVVAADTIDPPPGGNGEENSDRAGRAIDGDRTTAWRTKTYRDPFGPSGLKEGVGLLLDLGGRHEVRALQVVLGDGRTDFEVRAADTRGPSPDDYRMVAETADAGGDTQVRLREPVQARYLLLWFTSLPAVDSSDYRGSVSEVVVRG